MSWQVYLSYRRRTTPAQGNRGQEYGEVHAFDLEQDAADFARRASRSTGWAPAGAYDHVVSDPIQVRT